MRAAITTLMLVCAAEHAQAQHEAKKPSGHDAPAAEKPAGHGEAKPAAASHAAKPVSATPAQHSVIPAPTKTPAVSAEAAVDRVMQALDRELGKPKVGSAKPSRRTPTPAKASKVAVSWKMQLVWPEAGPPDPLRVLWPEPVLESRPLRFSYIGLPK